MKLQKIPKGKTAGGITGVSVAPGTAQRTNESNPGQQPMSATNGQYVSNGRESIGQQSYANSNGFQKPSSKLTVQPQNSAAVGIRRQNSNMTKKKVKKQNSIIEPDKNTNVNTTHVSTNSSVIFNNSQLLKNGQTGANSQVPSNIVYFDSHQIKLQKGEEVQKTIMLQTQPNQAHPSNIPRPNNPQRMMNSNKKISKMEIDQYIAKYNNKNASSSTDQNIAQNETYTQQAGFPPAFQESFQNVQLQSLIAMQGSGNGKGPNRATLTNNMMAANTTDGKISITGNGARIANNSGVGTQQALSQMASHSIDQQYQIGAHMQQNRVRPKSSIPAGKNQNQPIKPTKKESAGLQQIQQLNQFQIVNNSQIRTQANQSHQQYVQNDVNNGNLAIQFGSNTNVAQQATAPQSATLRAPIVNENFQGTQSSNIPSTAVSGTRKNKVMTNQQNAFVQQQNSYIVTKQLQLQNMQVSQQSENSNQQVFFEKRNRSRGAPTGTTTVSTSAIAAGVLVTMQPSSVTNTTTKIQGSPGILSQTGQKPTRQSVLTQNDLSISSQTQGTSLIKDFNASLIVRDNNNIKNNQQSLMNPNQIMNQIQNFNSGNNQQRSISGVVENGKVDPMQQNLVGTNVMFNNVGQIVTSNGQAQQINNIAFSNSAIKQRYQNQSQNVDDIQSSDRKQQQSAYKRQMNAQMVSAGNTVTSGQFIQNSDNMNKENMTVKQMSRKLPSGQNLTGISGSHGSSQSFHGTTNMTMQLNSISLGIDPQNIVNKTLNPVNFNQNIPQPNKTSQNGANSNNTLNSVTNLKTPTEFMRDVQPQHQMAHSQKQQSAKHNQIQQVQQDNLEMHLLPSTNKFFKRTYRHFFRRRMNQMDRPIIIINFQGVLGDFFKDNGLSMKQDHIMSKQYVAQINSQINSSGPSGSGVNASQTDSQQTNLWVRIGTIDGLKYLSKHFQIVVFNKDTSFEDHGPNYSQINVIHSYMQQNDITIDAIYSSSQQIQQQVQQQKMEQPTTTGSKKKNEKKDENILKQPTKQGDIWEDYKQIFMDFSLNNDTKIRDKVLFVNSFDADFNARQEEMKIDRMGYFLIDARSKPAKHLVEGLPLSYETKEKEIDLNKGGALKFNKLAKQEVVTKEMPVTILIPNPRNMYTQQISFASIAKTIMTLCFLGQKKSNFAFNQGADPINSIFSNIKYLQEFDVKVQKDQCLIQYNPNQNNKNQSSLNTNLAPQAQAQNQNRNISTQNSQNSQNAPANNFVRKSSNINSRPRSSNSHGRILNANSSQSQHQNSFQNGQEDQEKDQKNQDVQQTKETMVIPLTDQLFQNMSWAASFDFINQQDMQRDILGLVAVKSNLIWRYFLSLLKQRSNIKQLREKRAIEIKKLLDKLEQLHNEEGKSRKQLQIQEIYEKLKKVQQNGNPLTNMMARNLKVFIKIYAEVKRKSKRELENFTEALLMDQKMAELEKQSLESRILVLGINKPNQFFNTHPRVYEKVNVQFSQISKKEEQATMSRLYENSVNNTNLMSSVLINQKQRTGTAGPSPQQQNHYSSISSNGDAQNNSVNDSTRNLIDSTSKKLQSGKAAGYGKKKSSFVAVNSGGSQGSGATTMGNSGGSNTTGIQGAIGNFSSNISSQYSRKKINARVIEPNTANIATEGSTTRRSNQSSDHQRFASSSRLT